MPIRLLLAFLAAVLAASPATAWWDYGHATVAQIAMRTVRPDTRTAILALLSHADELGTPDCPAATIEQASVWADCVRGDKRFAHTAPWHFQNVNICRPFELACEDGNCVSAQVERQARLLADTSLTPPQRLQALAFVVHFVADLHQPLHTGDRDDRGGNQLRANYGLIGGRTNLHGIWDGYLAERAISTPPGEASGLIASVPRAERDRLGQGAAADWSREGWQAARDLAYRTALGDPCGPLPPGRPALREHQVQSLIPAVRRQVLAGGLRLARLLDEALSSGAPVTRPPPR